MYKIAIIGNEDAVAGFAAIGIDAFPAEDYREAHRLVLSLAQNQYAVIFLMEHLAKDMDETLNEFIDQTLPAIILVPDHTGSMGLGMAGVKHTVEKAVGTDIIFRKEG